MSRINITSKHNGDIFFYNKSVKADTTIEFIFDTEINFDLLNANHIEASLNGINLDEYFTKKDITIRGSYIVDSSQLYVAFYKYNQSNDNQ